MAQIDLKFYKGQDRYTDGQIENDMLEYVKRRNDLDKITLSDGRWPVFYHFSPLRENILSWYDFNENCTILEVGAGCGALTGLLCKKAKKVYANEMSKQRAEILYNRYSDVENLDIYVGSIMEVELQEKFDYVILMGVLEYAGVFCDGDTPYNDLINKLKGFLKPEGRLLIGIENKFGIKYFSGAPEDHTGGFFDGINGYKDEKVRTFSKTEIIDILNKSGFNNYRFFYPYPDYKFTTEVFTEETLKLFNSESGRIALPDAERFAFFNENNVLKTFINEGYGGFFCNSFLIETSIEEIDKENNITYAKINSDRKVQFGICTIIKYGNKDNKKVYKIPLTNDSEKHINNIVKNSCDLNKFGFKYVPCRLDNSILEMDYINLPTMHSELQLLFRNKDVVNIWHTLDVLWEELKENSFWCDDIITDEFIAVFGNNRYNKVSYFCVNPANIDLIFNNLFINNKNIFVIDAEWVFDFPIPIDFIFWRAIVTFFLSIDDEESLVISIDDILKKYSISLADIPVFKSWNTFFYQNYVEHGKRIEYFDKPTYNLNFKEVINNFANKDIVYTYLYLDMGDGFSEANKLTSKINCSTNKIKITFDIPLGTKNIRWDPIENEWCSCKVIKVYTENSELSIVPYNAIKTEEADVFMDFDPVYNIIGPIDNATTLTIEVLMNIGDKTSISEIIYKYIKQQERLFNNLLDKENNNELIKKDLLEQRERLTELLNSENKEKSRLNSLLEQKEYFIKDLIDREEKEKVRLNNLLALNENLNTKVDELNLEILRMQGTVAWKLHAFIQKLKTRVKILLK